MYDEDVVSASAPWVLGFLRAVIAKPTKSLGSSFLKEISLMVVEVDHY